MSDNGVLILFSYQSLGYNPLEVCTMKCRYCLNDPNDLVLIPESPEEADITQSAFACLDCAIERGIFCVTHQRAHQSFSRGGHACWSCIAEARRALFPYSEQAV